MSCREPEDDDREAAFEDAKERALKRWAVWVEVEDTNDEDYHDLNPEEVERFDTEEQAREVQSIIANFDMIGEPNTMIVDRCPRHDDDHIDDLIHVAKVILMRLDVEAEQIGTAPFVCAAWREDLRKALAPFELADSLNHDV